MKTGTAWIRVTPLQSIPLREGRAINLGGHEIAIFNLGDRALAIENRCPHRGGPLSEGMLSGGMVVCPLHAWKVCLSTGSVTKPSETAACVSTFKTCLEDGMIYVALPEQTPGLPLCDEVLVSPVESSSPAIQMA